MTRKDLFGRIVRAKKIDGVVNRKFNGENTPPEHLDPTDGDIVLREYTFDVGVARRFNPYVPTKIPVPPPEKKKKPKKSRREL